jgi:hypothetical protein
MVKTEAAIMLTALFPKRIMEITASLYCKRRWIILAFLLPDCFSLYTLLFEEAIKLASAIENKNESKRQSARIAECKSKPEPTKIKQSIRTSV